MNLTQQREQGDFLSNHLGLIWVQDLLLEKPVVEIYEAGQLASCFRLPQVIRAPFQVILL